MFECPDVFWTTLSWKIHTHSISGGFRKQPQHQFYSSNSFCGHSVACHKIYIRCPVFAHSEHNLLCT